MSREVLEAWAETRIWPSERDKFLDWWDNLPPSYHPHPDLRGDLGWVLFADYCRTRDDEAQRG